MSDYHVKRCFIALPLDDAARADVREMAQNIEIEGLRKTRPENLHLTVKFLGDVDDPDLPAIMQELKVIADQHRPFELRMEEIEYLPNARRPRVLALTTDCPRPMLDLFNALEQTLHALGFAKEGRAFHPHLTLGRFKNPPRWLPSAGDFKVIDTTVPVGRFELMESDLSGPSPVYATLAEFPLG